MKQIGEIVKGLERNPVTTLEPCVDKLHYENILTVKNCPTCKKVSGLEELTERKITMNIKTLQPKKTNTELNPTGNKVRLRINIYRALHGGQLWMLLTSPNGFSQISTREHDTEYGRISEARWIKKELFNWISELDVKDILNSVELKEENPEEKLTGCCDASIVEQTGRCSKCLESV